MKPRLFCLMRSGMAITSSYGMIDDILIGYCTKNMGIGLFMMLKALWMLKWVVFFIIRSGIGACKIRKYGRYSKQIKLSNDTVVWSLNAAENFTCATTWQLVSQKQASRSSLVEVDLVP